MAVNINITVFRDVMPHCT